MLFRRRDKKPLLPMLYGYVWPQMGWRRTIAYYWHRLQRIPGTPASIAAGFACGVGVSLNPAVGTHSVAAILLAWALRGNLLAAFIGTFVVNPWTAPPVWFSTYYAGRFLIGGGEAGVGVQGFIAMFRGLTESVLTFNGTLFVDSVWPVFLPMLVGSLPLGVIAGAVVYFALVPVLRVVQAKRRERFARSEAELET